MARRSPLNERYKKGKTPKGVAKKSAASAKPARKQSVDARPKSSTKKQSATQARPSLHPDSPEYSTLRKRWWIVIGIAALVVAVSFALTAEQVQSVIPASKETILFVSNLLPFVSTGLVAFSWWIDIKHLRPMMKAHQAGITLEEYQAQQAKKRKKVKLPKKSRAEEDDKKAEPDKDELAEEDSDEVESKDAPQEDEDIDLSWT